MLMEELLAAASTVETLFPATTANPSTKINKNAAILDKILRFIPFSSLSWHNFSKV